MVVARSLAAALAFLCGCATPPDLQSDPALPDARQLSEHPLDVVSLPQP